MRWRRRPYGYVSDDGQWFLERGGRMTHGANAWLIWRKAEDDDIDPLAREGMEQHGFSPFGRQGEPIRRMREVTGRADDGDGWWIDTLTEDGWLSEAKVVAEQLAAKRAAALQP